MAACALDHVRCAHGGLNERCLSAARAEFPVWNSELACLVAKIFLNACAEENDDPDWHDAEYLVVVIQEYRPGMTGPVRSEGDMLRGKPRLV